MPAGLDRKNPPEYVGEEKVRNSEMTVAESQRAAFSDTETRSVDASVNDVAEAVHAVLESMDMGIVSDTSTEPGRLIEATYTSTLGGHGNFPSY